ncbi:MAG: hypothetical protein JW951_06275, partial [Lentisphaerae bacterium]|nr:hypothetical protein [Lentisphaerota bacterium]
HTDYQLAMLQDYRATVLITTPSNARELSDLMSRRGIDPQTLHLRVVLLSRPVPDGQRRALNAALSADVRCNFGVAEVLDPGLCVECPQGRLHVNEDHFLPEIIDEQLVVTTLSREAMPLLRYRTQIACEIEYARCPCGRTGAVVHPGRRLDGRLRVNEMPLYESQIAAVLAETGAAGRPFEVDISEKKVIVSIELNEALFSDTMRRVVDLQREIERDLLLKLGVPADVRFVSPGSTP